jgi:hypothetical protein
MELIVEDFNGLDSSCFEDKISGRTILSFVNLYVNKFLH